MINEKIETQRFVVSFPLLPLLLLLVLVLSLQIRGNTRVKLSSGSSVWWFFEARDAPPHSSPTGSRSQ